MFTGDWVWSRFRPSILSLAFPNHFLEHDRAESRA